MLGIFVVTLTAIYWILANNHLTKFTKETLMEWFGCQEEEQEPDEVMDIENFGIYMG